ncbi:MAG: nitroreductase [Pseudopedobacter saltans]|uniref:Putative NAD(P)H nitroreductase n=1 Tax=Pseudopedobacter saltans TaxID=151895 RepID=A0A2W5F664_9SPHI|nr:MAG: nitroreductase [Pseudopedobacter saltans]
MKNFEAIAECIQTRRSIKPMAMNGKIIPDETIQQLLELADWAPTHALTEPWRFLVYSGDAMQQFAKAQADLYKSITPVDQFKEATYDKISTNCVTVSHNILVYMKRGNNPNIPALEEICAVSAAVENLLLGASAAGIGALWSTGGVTLKPEFKEFLQLGPEDQVIGQIYLGYSDTTREGSRNVPLSEKVKWMK